MDMIEFTNRDGKFYLYPNDAISQHIMAGSVWEDHFNVIASALMPTTGVVLDCGANFGYNSVVMSKYSSTDVRLICFEPQRRILEQLDLNLKTNGIVNYELHCKCLGETSGISVQLNPVNYDAHWINIGDTSIGSGGEYSETLAIDDLSLEDVKFMKIDVQGYELFLLRGALDTIRRCKPHLFIELEAHQLIKFGVLKEDVISLLKELDYAIFNVNLASYKDDYLCVSDTNNLGDLINTLPLLKV